MGTAVRVAGATKLGDTVHLSQLGRPVTSLHYVCRNLLGTKKTQVETSPAPVACFIIQCHCLWRPLAVCVVSFCYVASLPFFGFELLEPGHYQWRALRFCGVLLCLSTSLACSLSVEPSWTGFCIQGDSSKMTDCVVERTCQYVSGHCKVSPNQAGRIPICNAVTGLKGLAPAM